MKKILSKSIQDSINLKKKLLKLEKQISDSISLISKAIKNGNKIMICGNGGSAADAQHLAAEFLIRLRPNYNRDPWPVLSLAMDSSTLTACSNDFSFNDIFSRPLYALGKPGDVLICISTSGNSKNVLKAINLSKKKKIKSLSLIGKNGGKLRNKSDIELIVPSQNTARIQEMHIFIGHFIFEQVENFLLKK